MSSPLELQFTDPAARAIEERDIPAVIALFKLNYGDDYPLPEFYDERWVKRGIYSDHILWLVLEEEGEVVASGACVLDYGDGNDQIGEIGRLVVHPARRGRGLGRRLVRAILEAADDAVDFAFGEARTVHPLSQGLFEGAGFAVTGFLPQFYGFTKTRESYVVYNKLCGNGLSLRREAPPQVIPEVAPLARHVLQAMELPPELTIVEGARPYASESNLTIAPLDRKSLARLVRIEQGRVIEPLIFGGLSLDQGFSQLARLEAVYLMAVDAAGLPVGAVGYQYNALNKYMKGIELVAAEGLRGQLCDCLLSRADELGVQVVEVNVSAYDARLQRTLFDRGLRPVAYSPSMIFHGTERFDVIKMMRLSIPRVPDAMALTEAAKPLVALVEASFA